MKGCLSGTLGMTKASLYLTAGGRLGGARVVAGARFWRRRDGGFKARPEVVFEGCPGGRLWLKGKREQRGSGKSSKERNTF